MTEVKPLSFELNEDMLKLLREEFAPENIVAKFADAIAGKSGDGIENAAKEIFGSYGSEWIRRAHQLGEEYPDRTYEVLLQAIDDTDGYYKFSLLPQRFLEIAYLGAQDMYVMKIIENNHQRLIYRLDLDDCLTFRTLTEKCGKAVADLLPCRHACLTACETIHQELNLDAIVSMQASMPKDGYCEFMARRA